VVVVKVELVEEVGVVHKGLCFRCKLGVKPV